jgi:hypothetical protein
MRYFWNLRNRNTPASIDQPLRGEVSLDTLRLILNRYFAERPLVSEDSHFDCWTEAQVEVVEKVRAYPWKRIKEAVRDTRPEMNDEGDTRVHSLFWCSYLGTPSGKFYTPFANGNLDPCPHCSTWRDDLDGNAEILMAVVDAERARLTEIGKTLDAKMSQMTDHDGAQFFKTDEWCAYVARTNATAMFPDHCPACGGEGSHEADLDSFWHAEMDRIAEREGLFVDFNEGNYFICASEPVTQDDADSVGNSEIEE